MSKLLTGNEALALGAYHSGIRYASGYPGTPSTEILENLSQIHDDDFYCEWAPNEKTALESGIGATLAGSRALVTMKHVGLNVAADPFFTNAYTGVNAGLVIITADEPGMHSSQNEQDNRHYARHALVPMFEPSDSQETYDMIKVAYIVSETFDTPVLFRMTTRVCHSKSTVNSGERENIDLKEAVKNPSKYVTVPANSRKLKISVLERIEKLKKYTEETPYNFSEYYNKKIGIVASGICYQYAKEVFGENASYFKVGFSYPLPLEKIKQFSKNVDELYIIEENDGIMEEEIKASGISCTGKAIFPSKYELTPDIIRSSFYKETLPKFTDEEVVPRPPALCAGCPHRGLFYELGKVKNAYFFGDIGCYTLGSAPPYKAIDSVICMGASISSAHGASKIFDMKNEKMRAIAIIGDSTFFHTGINSLVEVAYNKGKPIIIILDNRITGMTGHQNNPGSGYTLMGEEVEPINIEALVKTIGIKNVKTINPNDLKSVKDTLKWAMELDEASVIITRYPCVLKKITESENKEFNNPYKETCVVDNNLCIGCKACIKSGCPALSFDEKTNTVKINRSSCVACTVCMQICPKNAITKEVR